MPAKTHWWSLPSTGCWEGRSRRYMHLTDSSRYWTTTETVGNCCSMHDTIVATTRSPCRDTGCIHARGGARRIEARDSTLSFHHVHLAMYLILFVESASHHHHPLIVRRRCATTGIDRPTHPHAMRDAICPTISTHSSQFPLLASSSRRSSGSRHLRVLSRVCGRRGRAEAVLSCCIDGGG